MDTVTPAQLDVMTGYASWAYSFNLYPPTHIIKWMNENDIEWIPMFQKEELEKGGDERSPRGVDGNVL
jgi:hypothetical protein